MGGAFSQNDINVNLNLYTSFIHRDVEPASLQYENHISTLTRSIQRCLNSGDFSGFKSYLGYFDMKQKKTLVMYKIDGVSCVQIACRANYSQPVQFMLEECDIDPNMKLNSLDQTPLHVACQNGKVGVCKCLIDYGANVHSLTKDGQSCLTLAGENQDICKLLISNGVDASSWKNKDDMPMIFDACESGNADLVRFLANSHARMNGKNKQGLSPVEVAAYFYLFKKYRSRHAEMIDILIQADDISDSDKIKALELIGCERVKRYILPVRHGPSKSKHLEEAKNYWQKSLEYKIKGQNLNLNYDHQISCHNTVKRTAFQDIQKFTSFDDLDRIFTNKKDIFIQATIVMESNLGISNDQTILFLKHLAKYYVEEGLADDGIGMFNSILKYIMNIPVYVDKAWMEEFQYVFLYWVRFHEMINCDDSSSLTFETMIWFLEHLSSSSSSAVACKSLSPTNVATIFAILKYIASWKCVTKRECCLSTIVHRFINHNFSYDDLSLLHYCVDAYFCWSGRDELRRLKCIQLMRYLLQNGLSPEVTDQFGQTPLITCIKGWDFPMSSKEDIINLLIEYSHLDMVTREGYSALVLLKAIEFPFSEANFVPLQCLAANVIISENIPYRNIVPDSIADFIEMHQ